MAIIVNGIILDLGSDEKTAVNEAVKRLGISKSDVVKSYINKVSVDARRRGAIKFVYSVGIETENEGKLADRFGSANGITVKTYTSPEFTQGEAPISAPPVIAGFGPAGMFAGLVLSRCGYKPIILERGGSIEDRVKAVEGFWQGGGLNTASNVQFGEGGAGTFSDGKLTTRINDPRCDYVLRELYAHGAPEDILQKAKPHIGTDKLRGVVKNIREEIIKNGGEVRFNTLLSDIEIKNGRVCAAFANGDEIKTEALAMCIGHSARDTFFMAAQRGVGFTPKAFSVGVRIEHLQSDIDKGLYNELAGHPSLPKGEYQLSHRVGGRGVYTFCMCPGGVVVPSSSEACGVVTNGMSEYARNGANANSALVVGVEPKDFGENPFDGIELQRRLEKAAYQMGEVGYKAPAQNVASFMQGKSGIKIGRVEPSYARGVTEGDFNALFPPFVAEMLKTGLSVFDRKLHGFGAPDAILTGVETRTSSPVRMPRSESLCAVGVDGLYPCGEGAGYAGGIVSAAVDGVRIAQAIMQRWAPPEKG